MASSLNTQLAHDGSEGNELLAQSGRALADKNKKTVDLPQLITASQQSWYKRLSNIGGGNNAEGDGSSVNLVGTLLSGGILGSYGISRNGALNREIDTIAMAQSKCAFNSTFKLTDVFTRSADKINFLATKVSACETLESDITQLMEKNRQSIALFENMRKAINPGVIGTMREGVANAWEKAKNTMYAHPGKSVVATAAATGAVAAIGPMNVAAGIGTGIAATAGGIGTVAAAGGAGLVALGSAAISSPFIAVPVATAAVMAAGIGIHKMIRDRKALETSMKMLEEMRANVVAIRAKTEAERDALLAKISVKYGPEAQVEKNMRELISLRCREKHPELIEEFETALQDGDPRKKLDDLMLKFKDKKLGIFHDALEVDHIQRYFNTLCGARSVNFRANVKMLTGSEEAQGPDGVIRFVKRLKQADALSGVRGKKLKLTGVDYVLSDMMTNEKGEDVLILRGPIPANSDEKMALTMQDGKVVAQTPEVSFKRIQTSLRALWNSGKVTTSDDQQLIQQGMGRFLELSQYKKLAKLLATIKPKPPQTKDLEIIAALKNLFNPRNIESADTLTFAT